MKSKMKIICILLMVSILTLTFSACDSGGNDFLEGTVETESLDQEISNQVGYSTKVPVDFDFFIPDESVSILEDQNRNETFEALKNEVSSQYNYPGLNLEIDFLGGPTIRDLVDEYTDEDGSIDEEAIQNDFQDEFAFLDYLTPLLTGLSYTPFTEENWNQVINNQDELKKTLEESNITINEFKYEENIAGREGILLDYQSTQEGHTISQREWILFIEGENKLIGFNYMDFDDDIPEGIVDVAAENLKIGEYLD